MKNEIEAMITDITATTAEAEDYTGEDGLLYCGKCHTPKEAYFAEGKTCFGRDRHPSECDCQRAARKEREAAEKRRSHLETVERLKRQGFTDKTMQDWTFANDNGSCPQMKNAAGYVARWEQIKDGELRAALVGQGRHWEKLFCRVYCKRPHGAGSPGVHDKLCSNIKRPCRQLCGQERIYFPPLQLPPADT